MPAPTICLTAVVFSAMLGVLMTVESTQATNSQTPAGSPSSAVISNGRGAAGIKSEPFSAGHRAKISEALRTSPSAIAHRARLSAAQRGKPRGPLSIECRTNISAALRGRPKSTEHRGKVGQALRNSPAAIKQRAHLRELLRGRSPSSEHRRKIGDAQRGELSCHWRGGTSFEPYAQTWTKALRASIRERDRYACCLCGVQQSNETFPVHHVDYNKRNCDHANLVTLCRLCHNKTNTDRGYWELLFTTGART
jgi:5-methylcytosine-specific restriction endonuclease McrA